MESCGCTVRIPGADKHIYSASLVRSTCISAPVFLHDIPVGKIIIQSCNSQQTPHGLNLLQLASVLQSETLVRCVWMSRCYFKISVR